MTGPGPIHMLNLVRLRAQAAYPDGRKATGAEAYAAYGRESGPVFERLGGRIVWQGRFELMLIGPQEERWDHCFIAEYPSVAAFAEMIRDPVYREAVKHRQAAVEDSRLIRHAALPVGKTFGEIPNVMRRTKSAAQMGRRSLLSGCERLARRAGVLEDRAEQFPALAVELHHLQLLVDAVIVRRGVDRRCRAERGRARRSSGWPPAS